MFKQSYETSQEPHIEISDCLGDLVIRGADEPRVSLRSRGQDDDADFRQEEENELTLSSRVDCTLTCPRGATVTIQAVHGNLKVKDVTGALNIGNVHGDVVLRHVGTSTLKQTHGDLNAYRIIGDLTVHNLSGDAKVRDVDGTLNMKQVGSDLKANGIVGGIAAEMVGADVLLGPPFSPGAVYRVQAGSDLRVRIPGDANLSISLRAGGHVRSRIPDLTLKEVDGAMSGVLGTGEATLEALVGGGVSLQLLDVNAGEGDNLSFDFVADLEGLGAQIEASITEAMAEMETRLHESLGRFDSEHIHSRVESVKEQALRAAQRAAERETERARLRAERAERRWQRVSGERAEAKPEPATEEERMRILRMVENGAITPEQAADLLAALEGR
ncbi:MAG TPA: hypothetical protein ENN19_13855 [Chloroflexi bacterium]|nr:hypothetical protein [Chloroflexota bacterium]